HAHGPIISSSTRSHGGSLRPCSSPTSSAPLPRIGVHTGECDIVDDKLSGLAVNIGARVAAQAQEGEVLVSGTVKDLVAGSGIAFDARGVRELKGLGEWPLYAVAQTDRSLAYVSARPQANSCRSLARPDCGGRPAGQTTS